MTEQEWLKSDDLMTMLEVLCIEVDHPEPPFYLSGRKCLLLSCACIRQFASHILLPASQLNKENTNAVEVAERHADNLGTSYLPPACSWGNVATIVYQLGWWNPRISVTHVFNSCIEYFGASPGQLAYLLREVAGNPFNQPVIEPALRTTAVVSLATAAYQERKPDSFLDWRHLYILSDALEEAGCPNTLILEHLRSPGPHVCGCWVLDLLLEKR